MKIIRKKDIESEDRLYGRKVQKLLSHKFNDKIGSMAVFFNYVQNNKIDTHFHSNSEELLIFPGGGKIEINDKEYSLGSWDLVLLEPGDIHGYNKEGKDILILALRFPDKADKIQRI